MKRREPVEANPSVQGGGARAIARPASDEHWRLALEAAGLGTFSIDVGQAVVHYSPELAAMLGFPDVQSAPIEAALARVHRADAVRVRELYEAALMPGGDERLRMEMRYVRPGGEVRWMMWNGRVSFELRRGQFVAVSVLGACADITERKLAEERLKESEARFRALVRLSSDWYWEQDENLRFVEISDPVLTLAGSSAESHIGKLRWELPAVGVSDEEWAAHRAILERREPFRNLEYRRINERGETIWLSVNGDPIFDEQGRFKGYRGTGHNITHHKEAEARLRESEARFRLLADHAPVLIWVTERGGDTYFNRPYVEFVGASSEAELAAGAWSKYLHPDDRASYVAILSDCEQRRVVFEAQARFRRADGAYRWMKSIGIPRVAANGDYLGFAGSTLDITDMKTHEERVALLVRELDHRVKNMLARVQAVIERTADAPLTTAEFVEALQRRLESMSVAHALLSRARWSGAQLRSVIEAQVGAYASHDNMRVEGPALQISPDAAQALSIVFNELATNAAKYGALSTATGRVSIQWEKAEGEHGRAILRLSWLEEAGPVVPLVRRTGYGTSVIRDLLAHELDAVVTLSFPETGVFCLMNIPIDEVRAET